MTNQAKSRYSIAGLLISLNLLASVAYAETGVRDSTEMVENGALLYRQYCSNCHGKEGVGEPPIPWSIRRPDYFTAMPLNESSHAWHHGDEQLAQMILKGTSRSRRRMPSWDGILSMSQVRDVIAYMKSLWSDRILACQGPKHMRCM